MTGWVSEVKLSKAFSLVLRALQDPTAHQAKTASSDKGYETQTIMCDPPVYSLCLTDVCCPSRETEEMPVQKGWLVLTDFLALQVLSEQRVVQEGEETQ